MGLSYKFFDYKVLEYNDIEKRDPGLKALKPEERFVYFEEFRNVEEGQVLISIEHW